jgi:hypothetical protein
MTAPLNRLAERINVDADRMSLVRSAVSTGRQSKRQDLVSDAARRILAMFDEDRHVIEALDHPTSSALLVHQLLQTKPLVSNPSKSGEYQRCRQLCREASAAAAEEIFRLYQHRDDDRVRFVSARWTFEQAWGKVPQYNPNADPEMRPKQLSRAAIQQRSCETIFDAPACFRRAASGNSAATATAIAG